MLPFITCATKVLRGLCHSIAYVLLHGTVMQSQTFVLGGTIPRAGHIYIYSYAHI